MKRHVARRAQADIKRVEKLLELDQQALAALHDGNLSEASRVGDKILDTLNFDVKRYRYRGRDDSGRFISKAEDDLLREMGL